MKKLRITVDGKTYDVEVELLDSGEGASAPPVAQAPAARAASPAPVSVAAPLASAPVSTPAAAGPGAIPSPLAGKVVAVHASPGQKVAEGDQLVTLEAMKMNTFVYAPGAGTVDRVLVAVGDAVEEGQALVQLS